MTAILFDIDGTLIESTAFDSELYSSAVRHVLGNVHIQDDWSAYEYVSDWGILRQIAAENGRVATENVVLETREYFGGLVTAYLNAHPCLPMPGAIEVTNDLRQRPGTAIGLATGGWEHTARMKLLSAGFEIEGLPLVSSDFHYSRETIMKACLTAVAPGAVDVVYVGDGPWDLQAARNLGWRFIGIGPRLQTSGCLWVPDYAGDGWNRALLQAQSG